MEQAINTFQKGLQTDTHPMIQGSDVLSDALNATFVTMNGDEVVLQNDMGNRRIDNAYLPSGYLPVGIKEYGGIIYIAAYNPITNRSQIGSFPSPERKLGKEYNLGGTINFDDFTSQDNYITEYGIKFLKADSKLIKLTDDTSLHAGDKFSVYCNNYSNLPTSKITNFNNIINNKVISPKNKLYTLSLGILNSQNEFVDITKTLQRWDSNNKIIEFDEECSDLYKFNKGYFIAPGEPDIPDYISTEDDKLLLEERYKMAVNTYSYKLVGPLYIKATLNHIENVSYNIYGTKEGRNVTLWIESIITYNCPDGMPDENTSGSGDRGSDDNYYTYYLYKESDNHDFVGFDFFYEKNGNYIKRDPINKEYLNHSYNPETNLYTITILKKYTIPLNANLKTIQYYYCVPAVKATSPTDLIYLKGLSEKGTINVELLGSGLIEVKGWRFYNNANTKQTILTYNFEAYPKYNLEFKDLKFIFTNVADSNNEITLTQEDGLTIFNGRNNIQFNWEKFREKSLYTVVIKYDDGSPTDSIKEITGKWFLTTELFNNCYRPSHEDYMADFSGLDTEINPSGLTYKNIRDKYCTIDLKFTTEKVINNSVERPVIIQGGKILVPESEFVGQDKKITILYKHTKDLNIEIQTSLNIKNKELYPDYIEIIRDPEYNINPVVDTSNSKISFKKPNTEWTMIEAGGITSSKSNNNIIVTGPIYYYDKYLSDAKKCTNLIIENGFTTLDDAINILVDLINKYSGVYLTMRANSGTDDYDVWVISNSSTNFKNRASNEEELIKIEHSYDTMGRFYINDLYDKIMEVFNKIDTKYIFTWAGIQIEDPGDDTNGGTWISNLNESNTPGEIKSFARIWCRGVNNTQPWLLFEEPLKYTNTTPNETTIKTNIKNIIKHHFENYNNIYICFYKAKDLLNFYSPNVLTENYNYEYNFELPLEIKISLTLGSSAAITELQNVPIIFKLNNNKIELNLPISGIILLSSIDFLNIVTNTSNFLTKNIAVDSGIIKDAEGNDLDLNRVYVKTNGQLVQMSNPSIVPHLTDFGGDYYGFKVGLKNIPSNGNPEYLYDIRHSSDGHSFLSYTGVAMVKKVNN